MWNISKDWRRQNIVRTFIAIEFPKEVRQQLTRISDTVQEELRVQHASSALRWTAVDKMHLTLRFLGETTKAQAQIIATGLREAANDHAPFALTIDRIGAFPNLRQPRVVWLGVGGDVQQLSTLQGTVEKAVQTAGFAAEDRPFSPHLTLARAQRGATHNTLRKVGQLLQELRTPEQIAVTVGEIVYVHSELKPGGSVYTSLGHFALNSG